MQTQIVITLGFATQTHWLMVVREYISWDETEGMQVEYADCLFKFWEHPFYKNGGVGAIPTR